jgi:hypothetical protein
MSLLAESGVIFNEIKKVEETLKRVVDFVGASR